MPTRDEMCSAVLHGVGMSDLEHALAFKDEFERLCALRDSLTMICNRMIAETRKKNIRDRLKSSGLY